MKLVVMTLASLISLSSFSEAEAHHYHHRCPHGQILRISLSRCVSLESRLAWGYVARPSANERRRTGRGTDSLPVARVMPAACNPLTQCGDPIEDRVADEPNLPDAFGKSQMRSLQVNMWFGK